MDGRARLRAGRRSRGHGERGLLAGRRSRRGERTGSRPRPPAARDARLGQSLPRGAGARRGVRPRDGGPLRARRARAGAGLHPHRLSGVRASDLPGLPGADGGGAASLRDHGPRQAARLRPGPFTRGRALPRRDGGRRELRVGEPAVHDRAGTSRHRAGDRAPARGAGDGPGLRRGAQRREDRAPHLRGSRGRALRAPQRRDARLPGRPPGRPGALPRRRAARAGARRHGALLLRRGRPPGGDGGDVGLGLSRRGPGAEPSRREARPARCEHREAPRGAGHRRTLPEQARPRRRGERGLQGTWRSSSRSSSALGSRAPSPASVRLR